MSLTSSLFSGISGLSTLGNSLQIIGDNISNVNTIGFKASTYSFQDRLSQATATVSGTSQIGRGTALGDISASFVQGSFESTGNTTDLAIGGDGFFVVREAASDSLFYTRAGNFRYNKEGYLVNPEGYVAQGWSLDSDGEDMGSVSDILLSSFTSSPDDSETISIVTNLDADATSNTADMSAIWDGNATPPLGDSFYEYQTTVKAYDSLGSTHDITVYYDPDPVTANTWNYMITCNPAEDKRTGAAGDASAGMLARGDMVFSTSSGTLDGSATAITMDCLTDVAAGTWTANNTAVASDVSADGHMVFRPEFISGEAMAIGFDPGSFFDGANWVNDALTTTQFSKASTTTYQAADGYGAGDLQNVDVDTDGVMTGVYSNGQLLYLNRVALAKFIDIQGLHKEGGNLYRETRESGEAITNHPGTNGLGSISPNSLEQSNVDIAAEFVKMITSQRGFQANSKIISTVDQMLAETIQMKR